MFNFTDSSNIGKCYKGFELLTIDSLPDYKTKAVYLRHRRTGLEVYHILTQDKENLFAFAFRTFAKDSKGTAHIMEHSTLCGSEKYPLKEPFSTLASTSLNTFLNAMTYPDKTVYPASSLVPGDYFNMMDVYADAVFFPKLDHETFIQEGHRLELDENGKLSIQGVVYNEMKGEFSAFTQIANNEQGTAMYPDSFYAYESGGDPLEIPNLTYEQFVEFHQKFYNPDNCLLFLYGDIPTEKQLDFLDERFMGRIAKKYGFTKDVENADSKLPIVKDEIKELQKLNHLTESKNVKVIAPETGSAGELVSLNWYSGPANMEKAFLSEVIAGSDSAPLAYDLKESGLGTELSPLCGNNGPIVDQYYSFGLNGVKKGDEDKVFDLVQNSLNKIYKNGVSKDIIDSAIMGIDFNLREVTRYMGPYSLVLMNKVLNGWNYGFPCNQRLSPISDFENIKKKVASDSEFIQKLVKKYFIDQKIAVKFVAEPSPEYFENREKAEAELIEKLGKNLDKNKMKKELDELHAYQQHIETPEETACIPTTKKSELDTNIKVSETKLKFVKGYDGCKVPLFVNKEPTNGIFYLDVMFPFDNIEPEYYQHMPFLSDVLTNLGWNGKNWDKCIVESGCVMGDVWGGTKCGSISDADFCKKEFKKYKDFNFCNRQWLAVSCKALTSQAEDSLNMMSEIITKMDFKNQSRFNSLISELKSDKKSEIISNGLEYSVRRCRAANGVSQALSEIMNGVSQLYTVEKYSKKNSKGLLSTFEDIYRRCREAGGIIHITSDEESLNKIIPLMDNFASKTEITKLVPGRKLTVEDLLPYIYKSDVITDSFSKQMICQKSQTGFACANSPASPYLTKESAAEYVFTNWFRMHTLWDKIRTTGGAYGVNTWSDAYSKNLFMYTYRDPTPEKSLQVYKQSLEEMEKSDISPEDIEKTIVSCYGDAIVPYEPRKEGDLSFSGMLYCNPVTLRQKKLNLILSVTPEDVKQSIIRLSSGIKKSFKSVVFCNESNADYGKKIDLPL